MSGPVRASRWRCHRADTERMKAVQAVWSTGRYSRSSWCVFQRNAKGDASWFLRLLDVRYDDGGAAIYRWVYDVRQNGLTGEYPAMIQ